MPSKTGVLLINLGTPDSSKTTDVRKYLREFLMDRRVIDIPYINRWMLVNLIIAPFRAPKSAAEYRKVWTDKGSPLLYLGLELKALVQKALGDDFVVDFGMRYQSPSLESSLDTFKNKGIKKLIVLPLYPQYASATTGSTIEAVNEIINKWEIIPDIEFVSHFPNEPKLIQGFVENAQQMIEKQDYDHFVFSFHGLPERQIKKGSCNNYCKLDKCCNVYNAKNEYCYRAQCYETARQLASKLELSKAQYTICFQSRLGKDPWIQPYIDNVVVDLPKQGVKKVLAFSPAFVADCLETTIEIGEEYKDQFLENGGEQWDLVESLNTSPIWVDCIKGMVEKRI